MKYNRVKGLRMRQLLPLMFLSTIQLITTTFFESVENREIVFFPKENSFLKNDWFSEPQKKVIKVIINNRKTGISINLLIIIEETYL